VAAAVVLVAKVAVAVFKAVVLAVT